MQGVAFVAYTLVSTMEGEIIHFVNGVWFLKSGCGQATTRLGRAIYMYSHFLSLRSW